MMGDTPLDMIQYYLVFGVHRFPESPKDRLTFNPDSKHIVVAHNDNFFKVDFQAIVVKILFGWIFKYCISGFKLFTSLIDKY
jgi:hypothetical protein